MCGICCIVCDCKKRISGENSLCQNYLRNNLVETLRRRGPDFSREVFLDGHTSHLCLFSATLRMRGTSSSDSQPLTNSSGDALLWNGEIFDGLSIGDDESDTIALFTFLSDRQDDDDDDQFVLRSLKRLRGPYAFVYYRACADALWFGRDVFGRRSLLWSLRRGEESGERRLTICSAVDAAADEGWQEVPAKGIFKLRPSQAFRSNDLDLDFFPWIDGSDWIDEIRLSVCHSDPQSNIETDLDGRLRFSHLRWDDAALRLRIRASDVMRNDPIVADVEKNVPTLEDLLPTTSTPFATEEDDDLTSHLRFVESLIAVPNFASTVDRFLDLTRRSVAKRVANASDADVGILFSGGVDCSLLAVLADEALEERRPIDLLNVAFQVSGAKSTSRSKKSAAEPFYDGRTESPFDVPDRRSGLAAWRELCALNPRRKWRFVAIDVDNEDRIRSKSFVAKLVFPLKTILDDSIGTAIWFAARGEGRLLAPTNDSSAPSVEISDYRSKARVVLLGSGADELLGGYSRHAARFGAGGWAAMAEEMEKDVKRISSRNLGRDDRVVADHGRESRLPYLDEDVADFVNKLPVHLKADPRFPRGVGEKILLRAAAWKVGLRSTAFRAKRAIQFGSRIAKAENSSTKKIKSSDLAPALL